MADRVPGWRPSPLLGASIGAHGLAAAALLARASSLDLVLAALALNHVALAAASMTPRGDWLGSNTTRLPPGLDDNPIVSLTFDDGPDPQVTPKVLDLLAKANARATFFCVGQRAERHPDIIRAMRSEGHGVENHTHSHPNTFALRGPRAMLGEILRAQEAIEAAGGGRPTLFRAPAGMQNPWMAAVLSQAQLSLVSWTRRGFDTVTRDGTTIASRLERGLAPRDILVLHDGSSALDSSGTPVVLDALPRILDVMGKRGLGSEALHTALQTLPHRPHRR